MKKILTLTLSLSLTLVLFIGASAQSDNSATNTRTSTNVKAKRRGPVFRATKDQINQAQAILKNRGFFNGEQNGKLDAATRDGLKKYQAAENLKVTGTLNKLTLEKMGIALTDRQRTM